MKRAPQYGSGRGYGTQYGNPRQYPNDGGWQGGYGFPLNNGDYRGQGTGGMNFGRDYNGDTYERAGSNYRGGRYKRSPQYRPANDWNPGGDQDREMQGNRGIYGNRGSYPNNRRPNDGYGNPNRYDDTFGNPGRYGNSYGNNGGYGLLDNRWPNSGYHGSNKNSTWGIMTSSLKNVQPVKIYFSHLYIFIYKSLRTLFANFLKYYIS